MDNKKLEALENAIASIEKDHGKGSIMKLGDKKVDKVPVISTGSLLLDYALGIGGLPKGRIVEVIGMEMAGKSSLALQTIAQAQNNGGVCAYVDLEFALDISWAKTLGVNVDDLYMLQPNTAEEALASVDTLVRSKSLDIIVVDSVAALTPKSEIEGDYGQAQMGVQARLMSQAMRKLTAIISNSGTCVIFINQIRQKIAITWGSNETTPGGLALKFYSSIRLDVRKGEPLKKGEEIIGHKIRATVKKNKLAPPFRKAEISFYYDRGFDNNTDIISLAVENNIIQKSGMWYSYKDERIGQGLENSAQYLRDNFKVFTEIESQIKKLLGFEKKDSKQEIKKREVKEVSKGKVKGIKNDRVK